MQTIEPTIDYRNLGDLSEPILIIPDKDDQRVKRRGASRSPSPVRAYQRQIDANSDTDSSQEDPVLVPQNVVPLPQVQRMPQVQHIQAGPDVDDNLTHEQKLDIFWKIIATFQWRHSSDGPIDARHISVSSFPPNKKKLFGEIYEEKYQEMMAQLIADDMFTRNNINTIQEQAKIISHAIALGQHEYATMAEDPAIYQYFIEVGDCQSLEPYLPIEMRHTH
jgi:hypothetical protein